MKKLFIPLICLLMSCTSNDVFRKGKQQLEQQGYSNVKDTGYSAFCCSDNDTFSNGFVCVNAKGQVIKGCFCGGYGKGVTIRFE